MNYKNCAIALDRIIHPYHSHKATVTHPGFNGELHFYGTEFGAIALAQQAIDLSINQWETNHATSRTIT